MTRKWFCAVLRIYYIVVSCCLGALLTGPLHAQSLFSGRAEEAEPMMVSVQPLLQTPSGMLLGGGAGPMVEARALALTDRAGLASRRAQIFGAPALWRPYQPPSARAVRREVAFLRENPPRDFSAQTDLICIAVSIYHEARNQPRSGQAAVASVILNRVANVERWGDTPCDVVAPVQFSYLRPDRGFAPIRNRRAWAEAVDIAGEVLLRGPDPSLGGADHYHATYVDPPWNRSMDRVTRIDDHIFWRSRPSAS